MAIPAPRPPGVVTFVVWKAIFLREALARVSQTRAAWLWLLLEPVAHIAFLILLFTTVRLRVIGGIDTPTWLMVGLIAFFMFRRPAQHGMNAVSSSQALFTYRQVKPVDPVIVRAALEGFFMVLIAILLMAGAGLFGLYLIPAEPLAVFEAFLGLWLVGLGFALIASVAMEVVPELGRIIGLLMMPMYFISGVIFPLERIPSPYREWLLLNPVAHGLEAARLGFAPFYRAVPEMSVPYLYACALGMVFLGLALHNRFAPNLAAK